MEGIPVQLPPFTHRERERNVDGTRSAVCLPTPPRCLPSWSLMALVPSTFWLFWNESKTIASSLSRAPCPSPPPHSGAQQIAAFIQGDRAQPCDTISTTLLLQLDPYPRNMLSSKLSLDVRTDTYDQPWSVVIVQSSRYCPSTTESGRVFNKYCNDGLQDAWFSQYVSICKVSLG